MQTNSIAKCRFAVNSVVSDVQNPSQFLKVFNAKTG